MLVNSTGKEEDHICIHHNNEEKILYLYPSHKGYYIALFKENEGDDPLLKLLEKTLLDWLIRCDGDLR